MKKKEKKDKMSQNNQKKELMKVKNSKFSENISKKWLTKTSLTVLLIAIVIVAYIGINLLIEKINPSDLDFTADKVYSLSDESKAIVENIDQDVEITLINMNSTAKSVVDFAYKYNKVNDKIKVKEVDDVSKEPVLANKYNLTDDTVAIIIKSGEKEKILSTYDLYTIDYTTYQQKDITEEAITNALLDVTITERPKIYYLTGHNKYSDSYMQYFLQDLEDKANDVESLDLLTKGKVPDDTSTLMITTLKEDITELERDAIINYIKKGGKIIIFTDANVGKVSMPNYQKVLDEYGVSISEGIMVEQDTSRMLSGSPAAILIETNNSSSITNEMDMNINACFMNAGKLNFKSDEELEKIGVEVETLATTGKTAFYRSNLEIESTAKQKDDEEGTVTVGALITKTVDEDTTSKLIIYSNNVFITNIQVAVNSQYYMYALDFYNNEDLALNSISYLTGREDTIIIRKDTETTTYTVTAQQQNIILTIIFSVPALIIIAGIIVWQVRRRKK